MYYTKMKDKIFINGLNAKVGGGRSIFKNYLSLLKESKKDYDYVVLAPSKKEYSEYQSNKIEVIEIKARLTKTLFYPFIFKWVLPNLIKKHNCSIVFNLADIPIVTKIKQIFLFDWSYAVYPNSEVWEMMDAKSRLIRRTKLFFFKRNLKHVSILIAQTPTIKKRLHEIYDLEEIEVVPNAVSIENLKIGVEKNFNLPNGLKLVYLSHYYPHKNLEIFIPLAQLIREKGLKYKIITTIEPSQHKNAALFLKEIKTRKLDSIIINIGAVSMKYVPYLYQQCDGLLMPTLLESFSGSYVEAMYHKLPILTSNLDFARGVCFDSAMYFDPLDETKILKAIETIFNDKDLKQNKIEEGIKLLKKMPDWSMTFEQYNRIIESKIY